MKIKIIHKPQSQPMLLQLQLLLLLLLQLLFLLPIASFSQSVGIGNTSFTPLTLLHIQNTAASTDAILRIENTIATQKSGINFLNSGTTDANWLFYIPASSTDLRLQLSGGTTDALTFYNTGNSLYGSALFAGKLGINGTTPSNTYGINISGASSGWHGVHSDLTGTTTNESYYATTSAALNTGSLFSKYGLYADMAATNSGSGGINNYGIYGYAHGSGGSGTSTNYGGYFSATGGTTNWAGYFDGAIGLKAGSYYTSFITGTQTGNLTYTLPVTTPTAGQVLSSLANGTMSWATPMTNPMTTVGDIIYCKTAGSPGTSERLAAGPAGTYLLGPGAGTAPLWSTLTLPNAASIGDILYAAGPNAISNLPTTTAGSALISGATPSWGKIGLTTHVSGTLPVSNGGTGLATTPTNGQLLIGNGTNYTLASLTAGSNITITPGAGSISIAASGGSGITTLNTLTAASQTLAIGTSGTAPAWSSGTSTHTLNIPMASSASVTAGLLSKTDYDAFNGKMTNPMTAVGDIIYGGTSGAPTKLADVAAGSYLRSGGVTTAPAWSAITLPNTAAVGDIWYASSTTAISALATNATATRYLSNTGTSNIPAWAQINLANGVTGTLPVGNGGTGSASQNWVDLSTTQTSCGGAKTWTGTHTFSNAITATGGITGLYGSVGIGNVTCQVSQGCL